ncbi:MAG: TolB family protein [Actinomycetota bacterium]
MNEVLTKSAAGEGNNPPTPSEMGFEHLATTMTPNARYVAFESPLSDLVTSDTNLATDAFVHDRKTRRTLLVSLSTEGSQSVNAGSGLDLDRGNFRPFISADARFVSFDSDAANLVSGDTNAMRDVFVRDLRRGRTERVSLRTGRIEARRQPVDQVGRGSRRATLSGDGRLVAFESDAQDLVQDDTNGATDIFVHDRKSGRTQRVSVSTEENQGSDPTFVPASSCPSISANGRFVAFSSNASNLVEGDTNEITDVFVRDLKKRTTERISVLSGGGQSRGGVLGGSSTCANMNVAWNGHVMSGNGRYVVFESVARDLVPNDRSDGPTNTNVFVHDRKTHRTERVSVTSNGEEASGKPFVMLEGRGGSHSASVSADGRFVTFYSHANDLVTGDTGSFGAQGDAEIFVHDRLTGSTEMVSVRDSGTELSGCRGVGGNSAPVAQGSAISADGRFVSFLSCADEIVKNDPHVCPTGTCASGQRNVDVFVRDRGLALGSGQVVGSPSRQRLALGRNGERGGGTIVGHDPTDDAVNPGLETGHELRGIRISHRPAMRDLFVVLELESLPRTPVLVGATSGSVYVVQFEVDGKVYEARGASSGFGVRGETTADFGLFSCTEDTTGKRCMKMVDASGGFGTTGDRITISLPLEQLGFDDGGRLSNVQGFTALGNYLLGARRVLDTVRI